MRTRTVPIDHGFAWMVCLGSFGLFSLMSALNRCSGILLVELQELYPHASALALLWVLRLQIVIAKLLGPLNGYVISRTSHRLASILGGLMICVSVILLGFIPYLEVLYPVMGLLAGEGTGLVTLVSLTATSQYFDKKKALALGLVTAGGGVGNVIMPSILRLMLDNFSFPYAMLLYSGIFLHMIVCGTLLRPVSCYKPTVEQENLSRSESDKLSIDDEAIDEASPSVLYYSGENIAASMPALSQGGSGQGHEFTDTSAHTTTNNALSDSCCKKINTKLVFSRVSLRIGLSSFLYSCGVGVVYQCLPALGKSCGISKDTVVLLLTGAGVLEIPCRVLNGLLADRRLMHTATLMSLYMVACGVGALLCAMISGVAGMVIVLLCMSIFGMSVFGLIPVALGELMGQKNVTAATGINFIYQSAAIVISNFSAGLIYETFGRWEYVYYYGAVCSILAGSVNLTVALYDTVNRLLAS